MKRVVIIIFPVLFLFSLISLYNDAKIDIKTSLNESYNRETNIYKADLTFEFGGLQKNRVENVKLLYVNIDNSTNFLNLNNEGLKYSIDSLKLTFSPKDLEKLNQTRPEYVISWNIGNEKFVRYAYNKINNPLVVSSPEE